MTTKTHNEIDSNGPTEQTVALQCPSCGHDIQLKVPSTINVSEQPELFERIKDNTLQEATCAACGATFSVQAPFLFLHPDLGLLIQVAPPADLSRWKEIEETLGGYGDALRLAEDEKSASTEDEAPETRRRVVFGLNHLNEKVFLAEHGFDDRSIELLKLSLLATRPDLAEHLRGSAPEFLVEGLSGNDLVFLLLTHDAEGKASRAQLPIPRRLYEAVERDPDYAKNFNDMADAWFVSWLRYVELTTPESAPKA